MTEDLEPHWPEALVALIDALEEFIEIDHRMGRTLLAEGKITSAEFDIGMMEIRNLRGLLDRLKKIGPDSSLDGTITVR